MRLPFTINLRPTQKLIKAVGVILLISLVINTVHLFVDEQWFATLINAWWWLMAILALIVLLDISTFIKRQQVQAKRVLPSSFSLNKPRQIQFELENLSSRPLQIEFTDGIPQAFKTSDFPIHYQVEPNQRTALTYTAIPTQRGQAIFDNAYVLVDSKNGFWQQRLRLGGIAASKVYPDFSAISDSFIFGAEQAMRNMGAHIAKRKGDGMEFNQLREFREGDTLKQVDWKATAKLGVPISKEYQEEKDQNVVFLLDCSRRMRAMEANLSYFDYALNALLMTSYIALDKGDAVGVKTFSGEPSWMPPIKGKTCVNLLLNHLYALQTSTQSSDYVEAAEQLLEKHRKRSLIILITNVRDDDSEDLQQATQILSKQHLVMVVALQERIIETADSLRLTTPEQTMLYAGAKRFELARKKMLALLKAKGVSVVDATHKNMHIKLVAEYLALKQMGRI